VSFDLEQSRRYWRLVPSGQGKHDTATWLSWSDDELEQAWDAAFTSRFEVYPEEDAFARAMAERLRGRRLLSIGTGLGFHEVFYAAHGAHVTCADIVQSNLDVIARVARRKLRHEHRATASAPPGDMTTLPADHDVFYPRDQDTVMLYGCLMHMPEAAQRDILARAIAALAAKGRLVLMLYTWTFVERTCGWTDAEQFDSAVFARASDPTVEGEPCPWSDWHDDGKLLNLVGQGFRIARRQTWNDGVFVWYELARDSSGGPRPFFAADALAEGTTVHHVRASAFTPQAATIERWFGRVTVTTTVNQFSYAVASPVLDVTSFPATPTAFAFDVEVRAGRISAGVLDVDRGEFVAAQTASPGAATVVVPCRVAPARVQLIVSNHAEREASASQFRLRGARAIVRPALVVPAAAGTAQ
jgi:2-polyprenyl-3-methyl-5-hydroxy-6-metoxy-1,4-benzoquinol methylase